jgi:hypothetical protein
MDRILSGDRLPLAPLGPFQTREVKELYRFLIISLNRYEVTKWKKTPKFILPECTEWLDLL